MNKCTERLYNGIIKENPTFVQMLGMCPTLAVTSSAINGAGMGLATTCILVLSNLVISMLRKVIPDKVRIPSFIVIIASFVTVIQFLMEAYLPSLNASLGIYIPLIVVNCIILGRAESYASKNKPLPSMFDGLGMGLGFTMGLTIIGAFRELIGKGCIFGLQILGEGNILQGSSGIIKSIGNVLGIYTPVTIFVLAPGAFFVLAFIIAFINKRNAVKAADYEMQVTCKSELCAGCANIMCAGRNVPAASENKAEEVIKQASEQEINAEVKQEAQVNDEEKQEIKSEINSERTTEINAEAAVEAEEKADSEVAESAVEAEEEKDPEDGIQIRAIMNKIARYNKKNPGKVKPVENEEGGRD